MFTHNFAYSTYDTATNRVEVGGMLQIDTTDLIVPAPGAVHGMLPEHRGVEYLGVSQLQEAVALGEVQGRIAAMGYAIDNRESAQAVLDALNSDDRDDRELVLPEVPIGGEWADDLSPRQIFQIVTGSHLDGEQEDFEQSVLWECYLDGWHSGYEQAIRDLAVAKGAKG